MDTPHFIRLGSARQYQSHDADHDRLSHRVWLCSQTNLMALDKTIAAIRRSHTSYAAASARCGDIGQRMCRAVKQVGGWVEDGNGH